MSIFNCFPNFLTRIISAITSSIKGYWETALKEEKAVLLIAAIFAILGAIYVIRRFAMNPYRYFDARRCDKICEMIRNDFDEIKSNTRLIRIDKGILKGMYPKVKDKYLDSCYENLKSNGDIVTDNNFVDWYKKRE